MRVLVGNNWRDRYLDYHRWPQAYRVEVRCCIPILSIEGQFYIRRPSLRMVLNYCGEIGIGQVARKIRYSGCREDQERRVRPDRMRHGH